MVREREADWLHHAAMSISCPKFCVARQSTKSTFSRFAPNQAVKSQIFWRKSDQPSPHSIYLFSRVSVYP